MMKFRRISTTWPRSTSLSLSNWPGHDPRWQGARVSASALEMLGVQPVLGRLFGAADEAAGAENAMILSYTAWQRHLGAARSVLGERITVEPALAPRGSVTRTTYTVVGVMPQGFDFLPGARAQFWVVGTPASSGWLVGRLAAGVSMAAAAEEVIAALRGAGDGDALAVLGAGERRVVGYELEGIQEQALARVRPALLVLMGAVSLVLLIACVNVANLLLARSVSRQRETAIRVAMGGGRLQLVRLAMTESVVLALLSTGPGILVSLGLVRLLQRLAATSNRIDLGQGDALIPRLDSIALDGTALLFAFGVSLAAALLFGLVPVMRLLSTPANAALRNGSGATGTDGAAGRVGVRGALVIVQVALAMVLLVGGALLMASLMRLISVDAGYDAANLITFQVSLPSDRFPLARQREFAEALSARLRRLPGVTATAYASQLPMVAIRDTAGGLWRAPAAQRPPLPGGPDARVVSRGYFETFGIDLVGGRSLSQDDDEVAERVLVINEALALSEFGGANAAVGQTVFIGTNPAPWRVVGVVTDVRQFGLDQTPEPQFFADARQWGDSGPLFPIGAYYAMRVTDERESPIAAIEAAARDLEPQAVVFNVSPMEGIVSASLVRPRLYGVLLGIFAIVGVSLACVGIYGVMSYTVAQRTREMGIRMALGAGRQSVLTLVLGRSMALTIAGVALGVLGAAAMSRYLETLLYEVEPIDVRVFAATVVLFVLVAAMAALVPARRATRVDPLVALRAE